jgi:hypothetical protein
MKDTRPVHMGTFEMHKKQVASEFSKVEAKTEAIIKNQRKKEKVSIIFYIITAVSLTASILAIYLTTIL